MGPRLFTPDLDHVYDPPLSHAVGNATEALWRSKWFPCTVLSKNSDGTYRVRWKEEGTITKSIKSLRVGVGAYRACSARVNGPPPFKPDKRVFHAVQFALRASRELWWRALETLARSQLNWKHRRDPDLHLARMRSPIETRVSLVD